MTDPEGVYTAFGYDKLNRLTSVTDSLNNVTTYRYDACSSLTEAVHPLGHAEFFAYDSLHRKTSSGRRETSGGANVNVTTYTYDSMDNLLTTKDPLGNTTTYQYNLNNRLVSVTDAANNVTTYGYDANGNRTSVTNAAGNTTTYTYDKMGRVKSEQPPGSYTTGWTYDNAGRLAAKTDAKGQTINYTYDTMGRLKKKAYPDSTSVSYTYDGMGNRLSMTDTLGTTQYQYDADSNLIEVKDCYNRTNSYTYDKSDRRKTLTVSFGTQTYEYDAAGRLIAVTDFKGNRITLSCDAEGRTTGINYPQGGATTFTYNHLDQPVGINSNTPIGNYYNISHQYNGNGCISSTTINSNIYSNPYNYTYDQANRLTQVDGYNNVFYHHSEYTYDKMGNRLTHDSSEHEGLFSSESSGTYTYNSLNQLISRTYKDKKTNSQTDYTYEYDANGNLFKENWNSRYNQNSYDFENRLDKTEYFPGYGSSSTIASYLYDGDGRLMGVNNQGTYYQYDGNSVIADINQAGSVTTHYSRLPSGRLLSMYKYESVPEERDTYFVFSDVLGSTVMLFGKDSGKVEMYKYGEFGTYSTSGGTDPTRFTFTGMPYYNGPGLYQMGARYYNPAVGRFITRDTYRGNIYRPWTQNLYAYCNNNPVNYIDPTGYISISAVNAGLAITPSNFKEIEYSNFPSNDGFEIKPGITVSEIVTTTATSFAEAAIDATTIITTGLVGVGVVADKFIAKQTTKVVIGENMKERVIPYAKEIGAEYYKPTSKNSANWMKNNMRWIKEQIKKGKEIIDIGIDPEREARSEFYQMEKRVLEEAGYPVTNLP